MTGLPRPDRWPEVRASGVRRPARDRAASLDDLVVVDAGFGLEPRRSSTRSTRPPQRDAMTMAALEAADDVVVVASADPVGPDPAGPRAARPGRRAAPRARTLVVVNRMRPGLGWAPRRRGRHGRRGWPRAREVAFLPDDRAAADRALVAGQTLVESGDSALRRAMADVARRSARREAGRSRTPGAAGGAPAGAVEALRR